MSKEDTEPGLLSKVVKFVRNPATNWSDLGNKAINPDEALNKQLLKEMIERKRRNDFVRKREFDMLRKMRKREAMVGQDLSVRPSFFHSSMPSKPDDRANTIKKIDEIEAQMSMQWWKTKQSKSTSDSVDSSIYASSRSFGADSRLPGSTLPANTLPAGYALTEPAGLQMAAKALARTTREPVLTSLMPEGVIAPRQFVTLPTLRPTAPNAALQTTKIGSTAGVGTAINTKQDSLQSSFSASRMLAIDVSEVAHNAALEEASIRFASGDDAGAEAGLLDILASDGSRADHSEAWMTLFDFYRATAQPDKFEPAAIQFVLRFDRSAPQWFSMPEMVSQLVSTEAKTVGTGLVADWICPSLFSTQTITTLKAVLAKTAMPWRLDWRHLKTIDVAAVEPLCAIFNHWSSDAIQLRFIGEAELLKTLQTATPSGAEETAQQWWKLRMEVLRVTGRHEEFELVALDFCVTYEVSPPAWEGARCEYKPLAQDGGAVDGPTFIGDAYRDSTQSSMSILEGGDTQMDGLSLQPDNIVAIELSGQVQGDAIDVLDKLEAKLAGAEIMLISCSKLIRVDFSAAGTLLNWVSARQAENRLVQFSEVNRLVAVFFNVIGITAHARVTTRVD